MVKKNSLAMCKFIVTVVAVVSFSGCSGCGGHKSPLSFVPEEAMFVVVVPSVKNTLIHAKSLFDKFKESPLIGMLYASQKPALVKELGFDPEEPETLKQNGIDPSSSAVFALIGDEEAQIVFGIIDEKKAEKFIRSKLTQVYSGALEFSEQKVSGVNVTLVTSKEGKINKAAWTYFKKHFVMVFEKNSGKAGESVARLVNLKKSLKDNKTFQTIQGKVGANDVLFFINGDVAKKQATKSLEEKLANAQSEWGKKNAKQEAETANNMFSFFKGGAFGLRISDKEFAIRSVNMMPKEKGKMICEIVKGKGNATDFGKVIGADAVAVMRFSLDIKVLLDRIAEIIPKSEKEKFDEGIAKIEQGAKINLEKDIFGALAGRFALAVFPPNMAAIAASPTKDANEILPLVPGVFMIQVSDPKKVEGMLAKLEGFLSVAQTGLQSKNENGVKVYTLAPEGKPLIHWGLVKDLLLVATSDRLQKTAKLIASGGDNVVGQLKDPRTKELLKRKDGMLLYLNIAKTLEAVKGMDLPMPAQMVISSLSKLKDVLIFGEVEEEFGTGEFALNFN